MDELNSHLRRESGIEDEPMQEAVGDIMDSGMDVEIEYPEGFYDPDE
jgi:hypothetical protein